MASVLASFGQPETFERASYPAYSSGNGYVRQDCGNNVLCVAFSGAVEASAKFGVCKINENNDCFESVVDGTTRKEREPASVFKPALINFLAIWKDLKAQIAEALATGKTVVFTGHNIGGGIADLATIASLEKWGKSARVSAITFGFPLIGDEILARAVRRQGWDNHFYNVVSKRDGFASTLLAPCKSVSGFMEVLLPYWQKSVEQMNSGDADIIMEPADLDYKEYVLTVLHHACAVVNLTTVNNMEPGNKLIASPKPAVKLSPYWPFGYYLFCSEKGALFVENYEAVLPIFFYSLASAQDEVSISDHTDYGKVFHGNTSIVNLDGLQNLPLSQGAALASPMEIQLNALGLGIQCTMASRMMDVSPATNDVIINVEEAAFHQTGGVGRERFNQGVDVLSLRARYGIEGNSAELNLGQISPNPPTGNVEEREMSILHRLISLTNKRTEYRMNVWARMTKEKVISGVEGLLREPVDSEREAKVVSALLACNAALVCAAPSSIAVLLLSVLAFLLSLILTVAPITTPARRPHKAKQIILLSAVLLTACGFLAYVAKSMGRISGAIFFSGAFVFSAIILFLIQAI